MPVLGQDHVVKAPRQPVDRRHDLVAPRHRERAPRTEIELRIGDDQDVALAHRAVHIHPHCHPGPISAMDTGFRRQCGPNIGSAALADQGKRR